MIREWPCVGGPWSTWRRSYSRATGGPRRTSCCSPTAGTREAAANLQGSGGIVPRWRFLTCQETALAKREYHDLLARSRVGVLVQPPGDPGIGCYEGVLAGAVPVGAGSSQLSRDVPREFRYPAEWTASWEAYQRHKPELVAHLSAVLDRVVSGGYSLTACEQQLSHFFSGAELYDRVLVP